MHTPSAPRSRFRLTAIPAFALLLAIATPHQAAAQRVPRWVGGGQLVVAPSQGDLGPVFGTGFGIEGFGVLRLDPAGAIGLRLEGGMIDFGEETRALPLSGPSLAYGVQIDNHRTLATVGIGPQLSWPRGKRRPYAYATVGVGFFDSRSDLSGRDSSGYLLGISGQQSQSAFGAGGGGGLSYALAPHVRLDAGAEYRHYHDVSTIGSDAIELPDGEVFMPVRRGDLDMLVLRVGATFSLPSRWGGGRGRRGG